MAADVQEGDVVWATLAGLFTVLMAVLGVAAMCVAVLLLVGPLLRSSVGTPGASGIHVGTTSAGQRWAMPPRSGMVHAEVADGPYNQQEWDVMSQTTPINMAAGKQAPLEGGSAKPTSSNDDP